MSKQITITLTDQEYDLLMQLATKDEPEHFPPIFFRAGDTIEFAAHRLLVWGFVCIEEQGETGECKMWLTIGGQWVALAAQQSRQNKSI